MADRAELRWVREPAEPLLAGIRDLVRAVVAAGGSVGWVDAPDGDAVDRWLLPLLARVAQGEGRLAVLEDGAGPVALGTWERHRGEVVDVHADLRKLMVSPERQGEGLGRRLLRALVAEAYADGVEVLTLDVRANNLAALALYHGEGFREIGRLPDFIAVGPHRFDRVLLARELGRPPGIIRHGSRAEGPGSSGVAATQSVQAAQKPF